MQKFKKILKALVKTKLKKSDKKTASKKKAVTSAAKKATPKKTAPPAKPTKKLVAAKKPSPAKVAVPLKKSAAPAKAPAAPTKSAKKIDAKAQPSAKVKAQPAPKPEKAPKADKIAKAPKPAKKIIPEEAIVEPKREYNDEEIILTDADGRRYCRVKECDQIASVDAYCRYHYLLFWKKIQVRKKILTEGKLERYVEELTARYPDKYLEMLRKDLRSEKDFTNAIQELELDDTSGENDLEDEAQSYIEEVRGMSTEGGSSSRDDDEF